MRDVSRGARNIAEGEQEARHRGVVFGRRRAAAGEPVEQLGVGAGEQQFVFGKPVLVEPGALHPGDWPAGSVITVKAKVERHQPRIGRRPYRVFVSDASGALVLVYFNVKGDYVKRLLPVGAERIVGGQIEYYDGMPQIAHP